MHPYQQTAMDGCEEERSEGSPGARVSWTWQLFWILARVPCNSKTQLFIWNIVVKFLVDELYIDCNARTITYYFQKKKKQSSNLLTEVELSCWTLYNIQVFSVLFGVSSDVFSPPYPILQYTGRKKARVNSTVEEYGLLLWRVKSLSRIPVH